jgi:hypothetical protein
MTEFTMDRNVPMLPDHDRLVFAYWYPLILKQLRNIHLQLRFGTRSIKMFCVFTDLNCVFAQIRALSPAVAVDLYCR